MDDYVDSPRPQGPAPPPSPDYTPESAGHDERQILAAKILNLDVPKSPREELSAKIASHADLSQPDRNRLAHELAALDAGRLSQITRSAWNNYLGAYSHIQLLTDRLKYGGFNPFNDQPPVTRISLVINENFTSIAQISIDNSTLTTCLTPPENSLVVTTQLLTGDYSGVYPIPRPDALRAEAAFRAQTHEAFHTNLNPIYKQIVDATDTQERQLHPDNHLTVADKVGNHSSITAFQEAVVELATSEVLGTEVVTLPNRLLGGNYIGHVLPDLRTKAASDEEVLDLWYQHPLRPEVSRMCKSIIQARINGVNPLDLGQKVNEVILKNIRDNHMRHINITYGLIADIVETVIQTGLVAPTMPPLGIQPEQIDVFTPQRKALGNLVAQEWLKATADKPE